MSLLGINHTIEQINTTPNSLPAQRTTKTLIEDEYIIDHSPVTKDSALSDRNWLYNTQAKDRGPELIADTSSLQELEDFIDSVYYYNAKVKDTPNPTVTVAPN